jgi:hypothetical protein
MSVRRESRRVPEISIPRPGLVRIFYDKNYRPVDVRLVREPWSCGHAVGHCEDETKAPSVVPIVVRQNNISSVKAAAKQVEHNVQNDTSAVIVANQAEIRNLSNYVRSVEDQLHLFRTTATRKLQDMGPVMAGVVEGAMAKSLPPISSRMEFLSKDLASIRRQNDALISSTRSFEGKISSATNSITSQAAYNMGEMEKSILAKVNEKVSEAGSSNLEAINKVYDSAKAAEEAANRVDDRVAVVEGEVAKSRLAEVENNSKLALIDDQLQGIKVMSLETDEKIGNVAKSVVETGQALGGKVAAGLAQIDDKMTALENAVCEMGVKQIETDALIEGMDKNIDMASSRVNILNNALDSLSGTTDDLGYRIEKLSEGQEMAGENTVRRLSGLEGKVDSLSKVKDGLNAMVLLQDEMNEKVGALSSEQEKTSQALQDLGAAVTTNIEAKIDALSIKQDDLDAKQQNIMGNQAAIAGRLDLMEDSARSSMNAVEEKLLDLKSSDARQGQAIDGLRQETFALKAKVGESIESIILKQDEGKKSVDALRDSLSAFELKAMDIADGLKGSISASMDAKLDHATIIAAESISKKMDESSARLVDRVSEKISKKYDRIISRLTKKKSGPDRTRIGRLLKKQIMVKDYGRVLIIGDSSSSNVCEVMFDVSRRINRQTTLVLMDNRKSKSEEPDAAIRQAMSQCDMAIISVRYGMEDTQTLRDFVAGGKKYAVVSKGLRIMASNI